MIDQRPKPSWNSLAYGGAVAVRPERWGGRVGRSLPLVPLEKLSVSGVNSPLAIYDTALT